MDDALASRIAFSHRLADAARGVIRPYFRHRIDVTDKGAAGYFDPVTEADRKAEDAIRAMIAAHFPHDAILGEEHGETGGTSGYRWVLDPIDGTRSFIAGQPMWGTLIGLERGRDVVLGVLDQPFLDERFTGTRDGTEYIHANATAKLLARSCAHLSDAVICTTHPMLHFGPAERERYWRVERACRLSRYGGDCYAYALIVLGFVDIVIETDLKRWDAAAIIPIIEGAGGIVTDWSGNPMTGGGNIVACGDARVHAEALKLLNS